MIDEGELDWKIIAISLDDPKASLVNDVEDVEKHFPVRIRSFSALAVCWTLYFSPSVCLTSWWLCVDVSFLFFSCRGINHV